MATGSADLKPPRSSFLKAMLACVGIALFIGFCALGTWQVVRLQWKLDLISRVEQRVHGAPQALPTSAQWATLDTAATEYQPVTATGQWQAAHTVLTQAVSDWGAGFWVMTPLQLADGTQVLINRGFVPDTLRSSWSDASYVTANTATGAVTVTGLLRRSEPKGGFLRSNDAAAGRWFSRDVEAIAQAQGLPKAAPFFVDLGLPDGTALVGEAKRASAEAVSSQAWPRAGLTQIRFTNNHLVYTITWYGLALMVLGAAWLVTRYQRTPRNAAPPAA